MGRFRERRGAGEGKLEDGGGLVLGVGGKGIGCGGGVGGY